MEEKKFKFKWWQIVLIILLTPLILGALLGDQTSNTSEEVTIKDVPTYNVKEKADVSYAGCKRFNYTIEVPHTYSEADVLDILRDMEKMSSNSDIVTVAVDYEGNQSESRVNLGYGLGTNGESCDNKGDYSVKFIKGLTEK